MMRGLTMMIVALVMVAGRGAGAQDVESCVGIENDLDRLACYDEASGRTPDLVVSDAPSGAWIVMTEVSEFTDEVSVFLAVDSEETINCGWNRTGRVTLWIRCLENTTSLIFNTPDCHMTSSRYNDYGDVDVRIDDQPSRTLSMQDSRDNEALGLWRGGQSIPEIKRLFGGSRLIARMTPYAENAFTVTFDISGLEEAIEPLREACHW